MSNIENRVVSIEFDNKSFERNIAETLGSLDALRESLNFDGALSGLDGISESAKGINLSGISDAVENISSKFSALGAIAFTTIQSITTSAIDAAKSLAGFVFNPLLAGGKQRALDIENAKFQFRGLGIDVDKAMDSALKAVKGTSFGLGEAAKAAAQFGASGLDAGDDMTTALRGIAGAAAMSNTSFGEIADIFTSAAALGKVTNQDLNRFATRGLNAVAALAKEFGTTEAAVRKMATDGELDFARFSKAMDSAFGEHATKANETFTGALANMKAALSRIGQSFQTPFLENQRLIFNALGPAIDKVGKAFGPLIDAFTYISRLKTDALVKFINGINFDGIRFALPGFVKGLINIFQALVKVIAPVKAAFREIFPPKTAKDLALMAEGFKKFTEKLIISHDTADQVRRIFKGLFSIFSIGAEIVRVFFGIFSKAAGSVNTGGIMDFMVNLGDSLVNLRKSLVEGKGIERFFERISEFIKKPIPYIQALRRELGLIFKGGIDSSGKVQESLLSRLADRFKNLANLGSKVVGFFKAVNKAIKPVIDLLKGVGNYISTWLSELGDLLAAGLKPGDFNNLLDALNLGLLGGIALLLKKFLSGGFKIDLNSFGIIDKLSGIFDGLTETLGAMQIKLKAEALLKIAYAIAVLTASILVLSLIDSVALAKALAAISVGFGQLVAAMTLMTKLSLGTQAGKLVLLGGAMILLAAAVVVLALAVRILSGLSWSELLKGLTGVTVLLVGLTASTKLISKNTPGMIRASFAMIGISLALIVLSLAVKSFAKLSWTELAKGLIGVAVGLKILTTGVNSMPTKGMFVQGLGLIALAVGLRILATAVTAFADISWSEMLKGFVGIGAGLLIIVVAMKAMPDNMIVTAAGLLVLSVALNVMAKAVKTMGSLSLASLAKGIGAIAVVLFILAVATTAMDGALPGAAALVVVAGSLKILADVIEQLGKLSIAQIITGLLVIAAALAILGVGAYLLTPVIPIMYALGGALLLIGAGFALFGVGAALTAKAFELIAKAGKTGITVLIDIIKALIKMVPEFVTALAEGIIEMAKTFIDAAPVLIKGIQTILAKLLESVIELTPLFVEAIGAMLSGTLQLIRDQGPAFIAAGFELLISFLSGLRENIEEIATLAIDILVKFNDTLIANIGTIVDSAVSLINAFIFAIALRVDDIIAMGTWLLVTFLTGITGSLLKILPAVGEVVTTFITEVGKLGSKIADAGGQALVKFIYGISRNIQAVVDAGTQLIIKFIEGIGKNALLIAIAAMSTILKFVNGLTIAIRLFTPQLQAAGRGLALAIADGITGGLASKVVSVAKAGKNLAQAGFDAAAGWLGVNSPSKKFIELGKSMAEGLTVALNGDETAENSAANLAERATKTFQESMSKIPDSIAGFEDIMPVITPVLDLTKVENEALRLNSMMAVSSIKPDVSYDNARLISHTQDAQSDVSPAITKPEPTEVKFEQNIFAPSALTTSDIYRNTKSQIALAKEELSIS